MKKEKEDQWRQCPLAPKRGKYQWFLQNTQCPVIGRWSVEAVSVGPKEREVSVVLAEYAMPSDWEVVSGGSFRWQNTQWEVSVVFAA